MDLPFLKLNVADGRGTMTVATTPRLVLRRVTLADAPFLLKQLNEPSWLRNIGDKGARTLADVEQYIRNGPLEMYRKHGHGMYIIELAAGGQPVGMCGLVRRDGLPEPDIGFALLEEHFGKGYALEAATAVMELARETLGMKRVLAITTVSNDRSGRLLAKLGFREQGMVRLKPDAEELKLYASDP